MQCSITHLICIFQSLNELINLTVPDSIRLAKQLDLEDSICKLALYGFVIQIDFAYYLIKYVWI